VWVTDIYRLAIDKYFAAIGLVKAICDLHYRRFSGTVLTDNSVDRCRFNGDRYVLVRHAIAKGFLDISEF